jgi:hypothetical protein
LTANGEVTRINPFTRRNTTKLKMLLPVGKPRAWELITTVEGLASWFPVGCAGTVAAGEELTFRWADGSVERFRVRRLGDRRSSFALDWRRGAELRLYLHGRLTTVTLEVEYRPGRQGRRDQLAELPLWAFRLSNLKSVAMGGRDLRSQSALPRRSWRAGFIDD